MRSMRSCTSISSSTYHETLASRVLPLCWLQEPLPFMAGLEEGPSKVYVVCLSAPHLTGGFSLHRLTLSSVEILLLLLLLVLTPRSGSNDGQTLLGGTLRPDACRERVRGRRVWHARCHHPEEEALVRR